MAQERLKWTADGQDRLELRRPGADGTTGSPAATGADNDAEEHEDAADRRHGSNYLWAELMRRSSGLDVLDDVFVALTGKALRD